MGKSEEGMGRGGIGRRKERREKKGREKKWKEKKKSLPHLCFGDVPKTVWRRCENISPIPNCIICISQILFIYFNQHILQRIYSWETHIRLSLSSILPDIREILKCKNNAFLLPKIFCFGKYSYFMKNYYLYQHIIVSLLF